LDAAPTFDQRVSARLGDLTPAERDVTLFFQANREEVLVGSATSLASRIGTSDATVVRTVQALGYSGLAELRRQLADEIRADLSPASRIERTLGAVGNALDAAFHSTLATHLQMIDELHRNVSSHLYASVVHEIEHAGRVVVFGLGPSSALAQYFSIQLRRFGFEARTISHSGLLIADDLKEIRQGDLVFVLAYSRVYTEVQALVDCATKAAARLVLITDTLGMALQRKVNLVLPVARGRVDAFSMHTATMALIEALLVGVAAAQPERVVESLKRLDRLRASVAGKDMVLITKTSRQGSGRARISGRK